MDRSKSMFTFNTTRKLPTQRENQKLLHQQHKYNYDLVYGERDTNRDVYEQTVRKVAMASLEGINGTVFVYGQTGTGKTCTMMGYQRTQALNPHHGAVVD